MNQILIAFIIGIGLSVITVIGDVLIKNASLQNAFVGWKMLLLGAIVYAFTAFGWFFVMRKIKLSTLGVLYGVSCIVILTFVSVFYFKEKVSHLEIIGIALAVISLIILYRFA
ncbi:MAG TPA: transporter [Candidatus Woesearchaeota archaeon]|jgi:drug/metabolite transporter (DMT)-like permease|nr:transporter [Candidatus Woesearchaeota archaeon]